MPVSFGDIAKTATEVLNDDYGTTNQLKLKQKTTWQGAVASTTVEIASGAATATPAKLSWKFPKPFGLTGICVDKLDFSKDGKYALEASCDKDSHKVDGLKITGKTDLVNLWKSSVGCTYTGIAKTQIKVDSKLDAAEVTVEATHELKDMTIGAKLACKDKKVDLGLKPDLGVRFMAGGVFCAFTIADKFSKLSAFGMYKVNDIKIAATAAAPSDMKKMTYGVGAAYDVKPGVKAKAKFEQGDAPSASFALKYDISKGFTATAGGKVTFGEKSTQKVGVTLSVE